MKAVFVGSIANGFSMTAIVANDSGLDQIITQHLLKGLLAEAVELQDPSNMDRPVVLDPDGRHVVVYGCGIAHGVEAYGPFGDHETASDFAENNRRAGDEYEIFDLDARLAAPEVVATCEPHVASVSLMQYRVRVTATDRSTIESTVQAATELAAMDKALQDWAKCAMATLGTPWFSDGRLCCGANAIRGVLFSNGRDYVDVSAQVVCRYS